MTGPVEPARLNIAWVLVLLDFLVMFMQVRFLRWSRPGLTRAKNAVHTMGMNFVIYPLGMLGFWATGYGFMFGGVSRWPSLGGSGRPRARARRHAWRASFRAPRRGEVRPRQRGGGSVASRDVPFCRGFHGSTAATVPTGAMAERFKFSAFVVYGLFMSMFLYPLYGNWVWGGGWLRSAGDELRLGYGHDRFRRVDGRSHDRRLYGAGRGMGHRAARRQIPAGMARSGLMPGHNLPMAVIGTLILAFGWFGFNAGSTLAATDSRSALVAVNTLLSSSAGALTALASVWQRLEASRRCDVVQRSPPSRSRRHHRSLRLRDACRRGAHLDYNVAGLLVVTPRAVARNTLPHRRPSRRDQRARRVRRVGRPGPRPLRRRHLWRRMERRGRTRARAPVRRSRAARRGDHQESATNVGVVFGFAVLFFAALDRVLGIRVPVEVEFQGLDAQEMGSDAYPGA